MTLMMLVAGGILGLFMFGYIKREIARDKKMAEMSGKSALCPECGFELIPSGWRRTRRELEQFQCLKCGNRSSWSIAPKVPFIVETERQHRRRRN